MSEAIEIPPDLDSVLRAQLREGEVVAYARQPRMGCDASSWGRIGRLDTEMLIGLAMAIAGLAGVVHWVSVESGREADPFNGPLGLIFFATFLLSGAFDVWRSIRNHRVNRHTVYAVTNQRVLKIASWPKLEVDAWEASAVTEVSRRDIKPDCGIVRYRKESTLMYVPAPEACESAVRALLRPPTPPESQLA